MEKLEQIERELQNLGGAQAADALFTKSVMQHLYYKFSSTVEPKLASGFNDYFIKKTQSLKRLSSINQRQAYVANNQSDNRHQNRLPALTNQKATAKLSQRNNIVAGRAQQHLNAYKSQLKHWSSMTTSNSNILKLNNTLSSKENQYTEHNSLLQSSLIQQMNRTLCEPNHTKQLSTMLETELQKDGQNMKLSNKKQLKKPPGKLQVRHLYKKAKGPGNLLKFSTEYAKFQKAKLDYSTGLYTLTNMYKPHNLSMSYLEEAEPKAVQNTFFTTPRSSQSRLQAKLLNSLSISKYSPNQPPISKATSETDSQNIFLTRIRADVIEQPKSASRPMEKTSSHMQHGENTREASQSTKSKSKSGVGEKTKNVHSAEAHRQQLVQENQIILQQKSYFKILDFEIQATPQFQQFKLQHLQSWGRLSNFLSCLKNYLRKNNLRSVTVKACQILSTDCANKRVSERDFVRCLVTQSVLTSLRSEKRKMKFRDNLNLAASSIQLYWRARSELRLAKKLQQMKFNIVRKIIPVLKYLKFREVLKEQVAYKKRAAIALQNDMFENWSTSSTVVEVHIPSFSVGQWQRLTTHYMSSYENQLFRLWRGHHRQIVLVLPSVNQEIMQQYNQMLPFQKYPVHILVPQNVQCFPSTTPLASILYYSHQTLQKIKSIVGNRNAIIVPGRVQTMRPQYLLSHALNIPLYCSSINALIHRTLEQQKRLFECARLPTAVYEGVEPESTLNQAVKKLLYLIVTHRSVPIWLFKINGEFSGRGIAQFNILQEKELLRFSKSKEEVDQETGQKLYRHLMNCLQFRIRPLFQQLYRRKQFLVRFLEAGGIIEAQYARDTSKSRTYEIALNIMPDKQTSILGIFRQVQMLPYANHAYIYEQSCPGVDVEAMVNSLSHEIFLKGFIGYCSVSFMLRYHKQGQPILSMLDIKPFMTVASSSRILTSTYKNPNLKYLFIPLISHPNLANFDAMELFNPKRKQRSRDNLHCIMLSSGTTVSLISLGKQVADAKRQALDSLQNILVRGNQGDVQSDKQATRKDYYSLCQISGAIKSI